MPDAVTSDDAEAPTDITGLVADIVAAYVSNATLPAAELPGLIATVHGALASLGQTTAEAERPTPHMPIRKTVTPDAIISLEDGKPYKTLKRHLAGRGLTPQQYREKWGLPPDYPMAAPNYSARRSELARAAGLGASRRKAVTRAAEPDAVVAQDEAPARRVRRSA